MRKHARHRASKSFVRNIKTHHLILAAILIVIGILIFTVIDSYYQSDVRSKYLSKLGGEESQNYSKYECLTAHDNTLCKNATRVCCGGSCVTQACRIDDDCNTPSACSRARCENPGQCGAECIYDEIYLCADNDGCCPFNCNNINDNDCGYVECSADAECGDNEECTTDACINAGEYNSECRHEPIANATECSFGFCKSGKCTVPACFNNTECDDVNECTDNFCVNPGTYLARCVNAPFPDGTVCAITRYCLNGTCQ